MASQRMLRLTLPCAQVAQAVLRTCSGVLRHAQECSPSAQVKAAAAHLQTLKQNQRKKKVESDFSGRRRITGVAQFDGFGLKTTKDEAFCWRLGILGGDGAKYTPMAGRNNIQLPQEAEGMEKNIGSRISV